MIMIPDLRSYAAKKNSTSPLHTPPPFPPSRHKFFVSATLPFKAEPYFDSDCYCSLTSSPAGRLSLLLLWARSCTTPGKIFCSGRLSAPVEFGPTEPVLLANIRDSLREWPEVWIFCESWPRRSAVVTGL